MRIIKNHFCIFLSSRNFCLIAQKEHHNFERFHEQLSPQLTFFLDSYNFTCRTCKKEGAAGLRCPQCLSACAGAGYKEPPAGASDVLLGVPKTIDRPLSAAAALTAASATSRASRASSGSRLAAHTPPGSYNILFLYLFINIKVTYYL